MSIAPSTTENKRLGRRRQLASLLPNARFVTPRGDSNLPWINDQSELQRALAGFLDDAVPVEANGDSPLSRRETEVLRMWGRHD